MDPQELRMAFDEYQSTLAADMDKLWQSLTDEQRLLMFCKVVKLIYQGDVIEGGSYRYVLYQVCGFGMESYVPAQMFGYLDIHNLIHEGKQGGATRTV